MKLIIKLTKVSPTHHRFECVREDGTRESYDLETKSSLMHDLLHFAYEGEAKLTNSFYGLLAQGTPYSAMSGEGALQEGLGSEIPHTERIIESLTSFVNGTATSAEVLEVLSQAFAASGESLPVYISEDFIVRVGDRFGKLWGQWQGTLFGETMEVVYERELISTAQ